MSYKNVTALQLSNQSSFTSQSTNETQKVTSSVVTSFITYVTQPETHLPQFFLFILFAVVAALTSYCVAKLSRKLCRCDDVTIVTPSLARRNDFNNSNGGGLVAGEITTGLFSIVTLTTISPLHSPKISTSATKNGGITGVLGKGNFSNKALLKNISLKRVQEVEPG